MSAKVYQLKLEAEESVGTIFSTRNYEQFKLLKENRDITNVNGLKRSITKHGLLMPILVNETFEIIEGQHRFLACKSLKVPIHYIVRKGATKDMIIPINVDRRSWGYKDYLKYYQDNSNYTRLSSFMAEWGVSLNVVTAILYTNDCGADFALPFKKGTFLFGPEQIKTCESVMARLLEIGKDRKSVV